MRPYFYFSERLGREIFVEAENQREAVKKVEERLKDLGVSPDKKLIKKEIFS